VTGKGSGISGMKWITVWEKEPTIFTQTCMLSSSFMNDKPAILAQPVMLQSCIREVPASNFGQGTDCTDKGFSWFSHFFRQMPV
jgi:hypothetical protein